MAIEALLLRDRGSHQIGCPGDAPGCLKSEQPNNWTYQAGNVCYYEERPFGVGWGEGHEITQETFP
jgi:hypothetical protein